ncbi:1779_t:CDS:1, partial [Acaulospora colombiana]
MLYQHEWVFLSAQNKYHVLKPDNYYWDFELVLPGSLIETIDTWNGSYFRYSLKAVVERSIFFSNLSTDRRIQINRCLVSNSLISLQGTFVFHSWENKAEYEISVSSKYFCLGGKIPIEITIRPLILGLKVFQIYCGFKEIITYKVRSKEVINERIICFTKNRSATFYEGVWSENREILISSRCLPDSENDQIRIQHELTFSIILQNEENKVFTELRNVLPVIITCPMGSIDDIILPAYSKGITENPSHLSSSLPDD